MKKVNSKHIDTIHYEPNTKVLEIGFHSGAAYQYHGVDQKLYDAFENADSHGKFFHKHINGKHMSRKKNG